VTFSQTEAGVEKFISKQKNSHRNGKIDLSCISGTGLYYSQQIVTCPNSKRFMKALKLVSVNLSKFILAAVLRSAALCLWLQNILRKWFVTTLLTLSTHVLQPHRNWYGFCVMIENQFFRVFQIFALEVKLFYHKNA